MFYCRVAERTASIGQYWIESLNIFQVKEDSIKTLLLRSSSHQMRKVSLRNQGRRTIVSPRETCVVGPILLRLDILALRQSPTVTLANRYEIAYSLDAYLCQPQ